MASDSDAAGTSGRERLHNRQGHLAAVQNRSAPMICAPNPATRPAGGPACEGRLPHRQRRLQRALQTPRQALRPRSTADGKIHCMRQANHFRRRRFFVPAGGQQGAHGSFVRRQMMIAGWFAAPRRGSRAAATRLTADSNITTAARGTPRLRHSSAPPRQTATPRRIASRTCALACDRRR